MVSERRGEELPPKHVLGWLLQRYPGEKREVFERFLSEGRLRVNDKVVTHLKQPLVEGDAVVLAVKQRGTGVTLDPLVVVHDDPEFVIVDKPQGLLTSTNAREKRPTALRILERHAQVKGNRIFLIHRLDRDASGILVFARTAKARDALKRDFGRHDIDRFYLARVRGIPEQPYGTIDLDLVERADGTVRPTKEGERGELASTRYVVLESDGDSSWLLVKIETGRKHQIRAHLSAIGHPLLDDPLYDEERDERAKMTLRATILGITHPRTKERVRFTASWPEHVPQSVRDAFVARAAVED